jgi:hypothetical protein
MITGTPRIPGMAIAGAWSARAAPALQMPAITDRMIRDRLKAIADPRRIARALIGASCPKGLCRVYRSVRRCRVWLTLGVWLGTQRSRRRPANETTGRCLSSVSSNDVPTTRSYLRPALTNIRDDMVKRMAAADMAAKLRSG